MSEGRVVKKSFIACDGAELCVREAGQGDPLICLHAGVADGRMWAAQEEALRDRCRVIAYDRRGFGETRCEPGPFSHVQDLIRLLDAMRIDDAILMGCSQGGRVAIDAALARPKRVRALVLVACAVSGAPEVNELPPDIQARLDALEAAEARADLDAVNELEAQLWLDGPQQPAGRVVGAARELFLSMNGIALRAASPGPPIEPPSAYERLRELSVPTLVIWGPLDFPHVVSLMKHIALQVAGAQQRVIEGTAHLPGMERPDLFNAAVRAFLDGARPRA
jgi:pimeloyl-ACP methyl ester carboxylesterase